MLKAADLTKLYEDGLLALDHLNLEVAKGEIFCLLGANGAGKTTTINLFLNLIEPTEGRALINGIDVARYPLEAKKHVAYLSENVMLYENFSARQNLDFFAKLGGRGTLTKEEYYSILDEVGLEQRAFEQRVKHFSKGMRQKLGLAIAITKDAPALLLDEPTAGLDPKATRELLDMLSQLKEKGKAILICTHDIFRAKEIADKVGIMKSGHLLAVKNREEIKGENLERIYLEYMRN